MSKSWKDVRAGEASIERLLAAGKLAEETKLEALARQVNERDKRVEARRGPDLEEVTLEDSRASWTLLFRLISHGQFLSCVQTSGQALGAGLLVIGIIVGAGLILGTLYAAGSFTPRTTTDTMTKILTTTGTTTETLTVTSTTTTGNALMAQVTAGPVLCSIPARSCTVTLTNTGTADAIVYGCSIQSAGFAEVGTPSGSTGIIAGAAGVPVACTIASVSSVPGSQAVGTFQMSNGAIVPFSGVWSGPTSSADVTASVVLCSVSSHDCVVTLTNTGTADASVQGCSIQNGGLAETGTPTPANAVITAGAAGVPVTCTVAVVGSVAGSQAVGSFQMSNDASVPFSGVWNS